MKTKFVALYSKCRSTNILYLHYTRTVFAEFDDFTYFLNTPIFVILEGISWFYWTTFFKNVNVMLIESFRKVSLSNRNFVSFNERNDFFLKPLCLLEMA